MNDRCDGNTRVPEAISALELGEGMSLLVFMQALQESGHSLPLEHAVSIVLEVCAVLESAARNSELNKKLNNTSFVGAEASLAPSQVFLTRAGEVRLLGFSAAPEQRSLCLRRHEVPERPPLSPQEAPGLACDTPSLISSVAALLWELSTDKPWVPGQGLATTQQADTPQERLAATEQPDIPQEGLATTEQAHSPLDVSAASSRGEGGPTDLRPIVMRGLSRDPATRFQTLEEFRSALSAFLESHGLRPALADRKRLIKQALAVLATEADAPTLEMPAVQEREFADSARRRLPPQPATSAAGEFVAPPRKKTKDLPPVGGHPTIVTEAPSVTVGHRILSRRPRRTLRLVLCLAGLLLVAGLIALWWSLHASGPTPPG